MNRFAPSPDRRALLAAIAAATLLSASIALAQEPQVTEQPAGKTEAVQPAKAAPVAPASSAEAPAALAPAPAAPVRAASPMRLEMQALLAAEHEQVLALRERAAKAPSADEALALQREIEKLKFDTEVSLLRVQAKHARAAGRTEVATRIEAAVTELLSPPKVMAPAARPVPSRENPSH